MNAILFTEPEKTTDQTIVRWRMLGEFTDAKIRELSTKYGAEPLPLDNDVEVRRYEANGKIYEGWIKKGTDVHHGVQRIIKPGHWFEER